MELIIPPSVPQFLTDMEDLNRRKKKAPAAYFEDIEHKLKDSENFLQDQTKRYQKMYEDYIFSMQYKYVLSNVENMIQSVAERSQIY